MKTQIRASGIAVWLSATETAAWARKPGAAWPCSTLVGRRVFAAFDRNGLCDLAIDGGRGNQDCDGHELSAICADHLAPIVPVDHACEFVTVRQFLSEKAARRRGEWERALRSAGLHADQTGRRASK